MYYSDNLLVLTGYKTYNTRSLASYTRVTINSAVTDRPNYCHVIKATDTAQRLIAVKSVW